MTPDLTGESSQSKGFALVSMLYEYQLEGQLSPTNHVIQVILIPSYGNPQPRKWRTHAESWLDILFSNPKFPAKLWEYQHARPLSDSPCLEQILDEGYCLLDELAKLSRSEQQASKCPFFFICHSLGGTILKKALCLARERWTEYLELINRISGILFLASPHLRLGTIPDINVIESILRTNPDFTYLKRAWTDKDNVLLQRICAAFEMVNVQVPIISAYETKETKIHRVKKIFSRFQNTKTSWIVGSDLCQVGSPNERRVRVASDFPGICSIDTSSDLFREMDRVLTEICKNASRPGRDETPAGPPSFVDTRTLRSYSAFDPHAEYDNKHDPVARASSKSDNPTGQGTAGSTEVANDFEILPLLGFEVSRRSPKLPQFSVPLPRNVRFTGRTSVLEMMKKHLLPTMEDASESPYGLRVFTLSGMPGIGKTSTALEYAYRYRNEYDAVFWIHSDDENILSKEYAAISGILELEDPNAQMDLQASREIVKGWLAKPYTSLEETKIEAQWLIIFDNVDNFSVIGDNEYWPGLGHGSIIVTSRDTMVKDQIPINSIGIDLEVFSVDETMDLFRSLAGKESPDQEQSMRLIAEKMGGLPLAISHLAGVRSNLRLSYSDLARLYDAITGSDKSRLASQLGLQTLSPQARSLVQAMSLFDPDEIPEEILRPGFNSTILQNCPTDEIQYYGARASLLRSSLIAYNEQKEQIGMHRVVRDVARSTMTTDESVEYLEIALDLVSKVWVFQDLEHRYDTHRWSKCERYFPSIVRLRAAFEQIRSSVQDFQPSDSVAKLFNDAGWYWFERGFPQESKPYFQLAQSICEQSPNRASESVSYILRETHNNLATVTADIYETEASLKHAKIWMEMSEARKDVNGIPVVDYELGVVYNETGVSYGLNKQYYVAESYFLKSIETFQRLENYDDTMLGWPEPNLGFMYWVKGDYENAERVLLEILEIHANAFGVDDTKNFKTGKILYALGNVYESMGDLEKSFSYHKRCLKQYMESLGKDHKRVGDVCYRLTRHHLRLGKSQNLAAARQLMQQALKIFSSKSYYRRELARCKFKEGQLCDAFGDKAEATKSFDQAFKLRREILPADKRDLDDLVEADFDEMVIFWSR